MGTRKEFFKDIACFYTAIFLTLFIGPLLEKLQ